jgi:hypothetical protein
VAASYTRINYSLRPAKNIERKMIVDVLRRLRAFAPLTDYRYVGLGSTYFSDFALFHKALNIQTMISIEQDEENAERFEFNAPFGCVQMRFGHSTSVLPTLDWQAETIAWLDYDGSLDGGILADVGFVAAEAKPGSVLMITTNAHPVSLTSAPGRVEKLRADVGAENVPAEIDKPADLADWKLARACRQIFDNAIAATLRDRNAGLPDDAQMRYRQLFNFNYQDGAKMLTVGGLLYRADQEDVVEACAFDDFAWVKTDEEPYLIEAPNLTFREMRRLNEQLPRDADLEAPGVPDEDVRRYETVYRYFPAFVDAEI